MHVQNGCFSYKNLLFFGRSRCRPRRWILKSLMQRFESGWASVKPERVSLSNTTQIFSGDNRSSTSHSLYRLWKPECIFVISGGVKFLKTFCSLLTRRISKPNRPCHGFLQVSIKTWVLEQRIKLYSQLTKFMVISPKRVKILLPVLLKFYRLFVKVRARTCLHHTNVCKIR